MARRKIPDDQLTLEQRKRRERNEKHRLKRNKTTFQNPLHLVKNIRNASKSHSIFVSQMNTSSQSPSHSFNETGTDEIRNEALPDANVSAKNDITILSKAISNEIPKIGVAQPSFIEEEATSPQCETCLNKVNTSEKAKSLKESAVGRVDLLRGKDQMRVLKLEEGVRSDSSSVRWEKLFIIISHPEPILLGLFALLLSSYLVVQNYTFFETIETSQNLALMNAFISELILILGAASLAFASTKVHRVIIGAFLVATIAGLGVFFHKSLSEGIISKSPVIETLTKEMELANKAVAIHTTSIEALAPSYVSRRQELQRKIDIERMKISELNTQIEKSKESVLPSNTSKLTYAFWLRLAAMLLNAYLVHCLFIGLKRSWIKLEQIG